MGEEVSGAGEDMFELEENGCDDSKDEGVKDGDGEEKMGKFESGFNVGGMLCGTP